MRSSPGSTVTTLVVMGVSGVGKTTVALELQRRLGWDYAEGDDFHPTANKEKMAAGHPLDDEDRWPWLKTIAQWIGEHERRGTSAIVTCSALRRAYRDLLRDGHPSVWFAHVMVSTGLLHDRIEHRRGHYMPPSLLGSQLSTLEPLQPDEPGIGVSGDGPHDVVADQILATLTSRDSGDNPQEGTSP